MPWLASTCWSYLTFCPSLARGADRRTTARARASIAVAVELVRRAGVAMRERDVAGAARLDAERQADDAAPHRVEARRLGVEADERPPPSIACAPARERRLVEHRLVVRAAACVRRASARADRRGGERRAGRRARPRAAIAPAGSAFAASPPEVAQPAPELEALVQRRQRARCRRRRCARSSGFTGSAQSVLTVSSRRPCGSQSSAARRFSPTTPPISPACATTLSSVPYCGEPLRGGLRADLRHAGHVVDRVAGQREEVEHLVGAHAELGDARRRRRASRCSSC